MRPLLFILSLPALTFAGDNVVEIEQIGGPISGGAVVQVFQQGHRNLLDGAGSIGGRDLRSVALFDSDETAALIRSDTRLAVAQTGDDNATAVRIGHDGVVADLALIGSDNALEFASLGADAFADVSLVGNGNLLRLDAGPSGTAQVLVTGDDNALGIQQTGSNSVLELGVLGDGNTVLAEQSADDAALNYGIFGDDNTISVVQHVDASSLRLQHTGSGQVIQITQFSSGDPSFQQPPN